MTTLDDLRVMVDPNEHTYGITSPYPRSATVGDVVETLQTLGAEVRYRPNGDKLLVFKLEDGHLPEPTLPEPLDYLEVEERPWPL